MSTARSRRRAGGAGALPAVLAAGTLPAVLAVAVAVALGGCASPGPDGTPVPLPTMPAVTAPPESPAPTADPGGTGATTAPGGSVTIDRGLLAALPESIAGRPFVPIPEGEAAAVADPGIARVADRVAVAIAATDARDDWAIAWVVALRPGAWNEPMERGWREDYDAGACAAQGGIAGRAEATLGGRLVRITSCGALRIHHIRLESPDRLVAVTSSGPGRFGERTAASLRP
ncbi:MAG: hypothetical protein RL338_423 [Chloroflexota bacterium]